MTLAKEGFRAAPTRMERILEAANLFREGQNPSNFARQAVLLEALTTDDFPVLLGAAFETEAIQAQKAAVKEYEAFAIEKKVSDFRPKKLRDLFGRSYFEDVNEGEEYKGGSLDETEVVISAGKTGKTIGLTFELMKNRDFAELADFPTWLGNAAVNTENRKVFGTFVGATGLRTDFFGTVDTKPLTAENLTAAIQALAVKENHRGDLVDASKMVLIVGPGLALEAQRILNADRILTEVTAGSKVTKTEVPNPFKGLVELVVSRTFVDLNKAATKGTSWALVPAKTSENPAVVKTLMLGEETVDIRVKRDQGQRVGGGDVPVEEGSFADDTIWFRGRHIVGAAKAFTEGVYGSAGA